MNRKPVLRRNLVLLRNICLIPPFVDVLFMYLLVDLSDWGVWIPAWEEGDDVDGGVREELAASDGDHDVDVHRAADRLDEPVIVLLSRF